jgi:succinate dehydrogenase flavin-adding protein (antitoxin of CptAB toxin-antitoxin module)
VGAGFISPPPRSDEVGVWPSHNKLEQLEIPLDKDETYRRRLIMAAHRRGLLEAELILGRFVDREITKLSPEELADLEKIMRLEDLDLWEIICRRKETPSDLNLELLEKIRGMLPEPPVSG